jgi:hypothetical protein
MYSLFSQRFGFNPSSAPRLLRSGSLLLMFALKFFKPALGTTLAIVLGWLLSVRPAQAGYIVRLQEVGANVVATGSGAIDLTGLSIEHHDAPTETDIEPANGGIFTGTTAFADLYQGNVNGPTSFGSGGATFTNIASGDMVGIYAVLGNLVVVPTGYVSGNALSDSATWSGRTFATLGVTPGTYVWTWGGGANQNFTLQIGPATNITNISARAPVFHFSTVAIAGFTVTGTDPKQVVIRGLGPSLTNFNVPDVLLDPSLRLYDGSGTLIFSNNDWKATQEAAIQATGLAPSFDEESAILITLQPGQYTAILSSADPEQFRSAAGLVEVYDINPGVSSELTNVSTRGLVRPVMIGGFITSGGSAPVVVRGLGPTLAQFGVLGALADPWVTLVDSNGNVIQTNNNWKNTQQAAIQATGLAPPNDLEAAILVTVPAGNYTAILSGNGGGVGTGLLEVYKLPAR